MDSSQIVGYITTGDINSLEKALTENPLLANADTEQGISILQLAAYYRNAAAITAISQFKNNISLFEAASLGEIDTVKEYIEKDPVAINTFAPDGFTALGLASFFGHLPVAQYLLDKGGDANIPSNNAFKVAPLHSACATSNHDMAKLLLDNGADVNQKQMQGVTPLHSAAHNGQTELVRLLLEKG